MVCHLLQTAVMEHLRAVDHHTSLVTNMEHHLPRRVAPIYHLINRVDNTEPRQLPLLRRHQATNIVSLRPLTVE